MKDQQGWVVHKQLDPESIYGEAVRLSTRRFEALSDAEAFLEGRNDEWAGRPARKLTGWMGPIPIVDLAGSANLHFQGPWLDDRIRFEANQLTHESSTGWKQLFETDWQDLGVDSVPFVMNQMEQEGVIPSPQGDECGPPLNSAQQREVLRRVRKYQLPEIECCLGETWDFFTIQSGARQRVGHVGSDPAGRLCNRLLAAAADLEGALRNNHPYLEAADIYHFWTSLEIHVELAEFCRQELWDRRDNEGEIEHARWRFGRVLGSYAYEIRAADRGDGRRPVSSARKIESLQSVDPSRLLAEAGMVPAAAGFSIHEDHESGLSAKGTSEVRTPEGPGLEEVRSPGFAPIPPKPTNYPIQRRGRRRTIDDTIRRKVSAVVARRGGNWRDKGKLKAVAGDLDRKKVPVPPRRDRQDPAYSSWVHLADHGDRFIKAVEERLPNQTNRLELDSL
ncbi:MAG: hypothetical protein HY235_12115 [Acidobacteria bacterium]|nr:hypothetical protein [Acidobacteriota bacterium]